MDTYFASPERDNQEKISKAVQSINSNPVMSGLLHSVNGLLAILNKHRQVIALNDSFLTLLGIDNPDKALGLRPGEALNCIHAKEGPNGCGTSRHCATCGAAIAIVTSLDTQEPAERTCALTTSKKGKKIDMALQVRSHPIEIEGDRFLLLFLQDISLQEQHAAMQNTFFHDINNIVAGLLGAAELLRAQHPESNLTEIVHRASLRLKNEIEIERTLCKNKDHHYNASLQDLTPQQIQQDIEMFFSNHPAAKDKILEFSPSFATSPPVKTDLSLVLRILTNMITNGLEASDPHDTVKVVLDKQQHSVTFSVWNNQAIPEKIQLRVFQRNFSTKDGTGRGIGTYSMKMFGEQVLGGEVSFESSPERGTVFKLALPC